MPPYLANPFGNIAEHSHSVRRLSEFSRLSHLWVLAIFLKTKFPEDPRDTLDMFDLILEEYGLPSPNLENKE